LPADKHRRRDLMAHEMWHRVQNEIGFPSSGAANNHLDSLAGRLWLQLEWRALEAALRTRGLRRRKAISDALIFRGYRRTLFPRAAIEEREMEMHEGLAEYTGARLSGALDLGHYVIDRWLTETPKQPTFARSFAYASGPAYGLLLDQSQSNWRRRLGKGEDLGELLRKSQHIRLKPQTEQSVWRYARSYGAVMLQRSELEREKIRQKRVEEYKSRLVEGPVLAIQLRQMTMQMNPGNLVPLDSLGTVYPEVKIVDAWGILTVTKGALIKSDFSTVYVPAPANFHGLDLEGDGWTLQLNKGWQAVGGARKGDYVLKPLR
jgi:hypothetical protein